MEKPTEKTKAQKVVVDYYTGERFYLVSVKGNQMYVDEEQYLQIQRRETKAPS